MSSEPEDLMTEAPEITITRLTPADAHFCATIMSGSEPWITLKRNYEDSLKSVTDPTREVFVASRT